MARILLVENDRDIRLALCDVLEHEGQYVSTASNGDEALKLLGFVDQYAGNSQRIPAGKGVQAHSSLSLMEGYQR
jgi:DNA-binding NtrC family response regulator